MDYFSLELTVELSLINPALLLVDGYVAKRLWIAE